MLQKINEEQARAIAFIQYQRMFDITPERTESIAPMQIWVANRTKELLNLGAENFELDLIKRKA